MAAARRRIAVVGATGVAGQQFLVSLANHPWFEVKRLAASERSAGKKFGDAIKDPNGSTKWFCDEPCPKDFLNITVENAEKLVLDDIDIVFTAIESDAAKIVEPIYAARVPTISTASAFRYEPDVPVFLPGVNIDHAALVSVQQKKRGWKGFVTPGPNCTTVGLVFTLKPLYDRFGIQSVIMTSMQAVSGAGRSPGVLSYDILDNIIPYIPKEEEKVQTETQKILGKIENNTIVSAPFNVSCTCTRVNVIDGHTESVFVGLQKKASLDEVKQAWRQGYEEFLALGLPSAPPELVVYHDEPFRPQPRLDRNTHGGMSTVVGRLRADNVLPNGVKYVLLSHNTKMGAAKGAVLTAEYLVKRGVIA
ncbi:MAG TPA: aspartate-semialdehyde dehydrogenase [Planctomycetota bacterium]|nr:aspartate-semialdehyde dehydrogenase [Planctomycetota bacterium]